LVRRNFPEAQDGGPWTVEPTTTANRLIKTSWSICKAVAERLQENLGVEPSQGSSNLERLMDELRRRDEADRSP
jgi:hypothetical protein